MTKSIRSDVLEELIRAFSEEVKKKATAECVKDGHDTPCDASLGRAFIALTNKLLQNNS